MDVTSDPRPAHADWTHLFFSATGRSGRLEFVAVGAVVLALWIFYAQTHGAARWLTAWAAFPVLTTSACCVLSRRLHDRGRAGWWSAVILAAGLIVWPRPKGLVDLLCVVVLGVAFVDLALLPGQRDFNRFGPRP